MITFETSIAERHNG